MCACVYVQVVEKKENTHEQAIFSEQCRVTASWRESGGHLAEISWIRQEILNEVTYNLSPKIILIITN